MNKLLLITLFFLMLILNGRTLNAQAHEAFIDSVGFQQDSIEFYIAINGYNNASIQSNPRIVFSILTGAKKTIQLNNKDFRGERFNQNVSSFKIVTSYKTLYDIPPITSLKNYSFSFKGVDFNPTSDISIIKDKIDKQLSTNVYKSIIKESFSNEIEKDFQRRSSEIENSRIQELTIKCLNENKDVFNKLPTDTKYIIIKNLEQHFKDSLMIFLKTDSLYLPSYAKQLANLYPKYALITIIDHLANLNTNNKVLPSSEVSLLTKALKEYSIDYPDSVFHYLEENIPDSVKLLIARNYLIHNKNKIRTLLDSISVDSLNTIAYYYYTTNPKEISNLSNVIDESTKGQIAIEFFGQKNKNINPDSTELIKHILSKDYYLNNRDQVSELLNSLTTDEFNEYIVPILIPKVKKSFRYQMEVEENKDFGKTEKKQEIIIKNDSLQTIVYNFLNDNKNNSSLTKEISPYKNNKFDMGINVNLNVDSLSDKLSHHINYFNMDKYYGIGGTFYGPLYGNQFSFSFITRIDSGYQLQPLVVGNIETYWTNGVNGDFGIVLNNLSTKGFWKTCNVGIYTGAEFINNKKFFKDTSFDTYYDWEIGLSGSKRFNNDTNTWQEINLRVPVTYRYLMGQSDRNHTYLSPQVTYSYNWDKVFIQTGCQFHLFGNNILPISNGSIWLKVFYKLNRD